MASTTYASGKHALAECDRCGQTFKYNHLRPETENQRPTGLRVCEVCFEPDHPQNDLGKRPIYDPQALRHARPDHYDSSQSGIYYGFNPVGFPDPLGLYKSSNTLVGKTALGRITVETT